MISTAVILLLEMMQKQLSELVQLLSLRDGVLFGATVKRRGGD